jgi:hypothetical protein
VVRFRVQILCRFDPDLPEPAFDFQLQIRRTSLVPIKTIPERMSQIIQPKVLGAARIDTIEKRTLMTRARHIHVISANARIIHIHHGDTEFTEKYKFIFATDERPMDTDKCLKKLDPISVHLIFYLWQYCLCLSHFSVLSVVSISALAGYRPQMRPGVNER